MQTTAAMIQHKAVFWRGFGGVGQNGFWRSGLIGMPQHSKAARTHHPDAPRYTSQADCQKVCSEWGSDIGKEGGANWSAADLPLRDLRN